MRCDKCGKRFENGDKICKDDAEVLCMSCLEDRIWLRHETQEIAESLGYTIKRYKRSEKLAMTEPVPLIHGQVCMF